MYYLMNKDDVVAKFRINTDFNEPEIVEQFICLPPRYDDLSSFIVNRRSPKHRENIQELLKLSGCDTLEGFLNISHALSLIDTFWVKPVDSRLAWKDVSLYDNPFNEVIAKTAFEGGLHGRDFNTTSPEYGTDGSFAKCWVRESDTIRMLKRGSSGARNAGLEPYSEYYSSQIAKCFTSNFVEYDLRSKGGRICSVCDIFTSEDYGFVPYAAFDKESSTAKALINKMESLGFGDELKTMFILDAIIMNVDRHKNNFGFIVDNRTLEIVGFAPLFDHNLALLPYAENETELEFNGEYYKSQGPKIGEDWIRIAVACLSAKTRRVLVNLCDFRFERHNKYNLPEWRLEALEKTIHCVIDAIIKGDAMRRYSVPVKVESF